jgi:hypothetical protein
MDNGAGQEGEIKPSIEQQEHALYADKEKLTDAERKAFNESGVSNSVRKLLWMSENPQTADAEEISAATKEKLKEQLQPMMQVAEEGDDSQEKVVTDFLVRTSIAGKSLMEILPEILPEAYDISGVKKVVAKADAEAIDKDEFSLSEAQEEIKVGSKEDLKPEELLQSMQRDEGSRSPENINQLKSLYAQQGLSKESLELLLQTTTLDEETKNKILTDYVPEEKDATDIEKSSLDDEAKIATLINDVQERVGHVDLSGVADEKERGILAGRVDAIKGMLTSFNEKYNGKPEKYGKLGLKIAGGLALAFILFLLWELNAINKLAGKKK